MNGNDILIGGLVRYDTTDQGRATYLRYELINVQVTSLDVNASGD